MMPANFAYFETIIAFEQLPIVIVCVKSSQVYTWCDFFHEQPVCYQATKATDDDHQDSRTTAKQFKSTDPVDSECTKRVAPTAALELITRWLQWMSNISFVYIM